MSRLLPVGPDAATEPIVLEAGVTSVGRGVENTVVLEGPRVSRDHCSLVRLPDGRVKVVDAGSRNGTFVNGEPIVQKVLRPGDRLEIGGHAFVYSTAAVARPVPDFFPPTPRAESAASPHRRAVRSRFPVASLLSVAALLAVAATLGLALLGSRPDATRAGAAPGGATATAAGDESEEGAKSAAPLLPPSAEASPPPGETVARREAEPEPAPNDGRSSAPAPEPVADQRPSPGAAPPVSAAKPANSASPPGGPEDRLSPEAAPSVRALGRDEALLAIAHAVASVRRLDVAEAERALAPLEDAALDESVTGALESAIEGAAEARALLDAIVARLAAGRPDALKRPLRGLGVVIGASAEGVTAGNAVTAWAHLDPANVVAIARAVEPPPAALVGLAAYAFANGLDDEAHRALEDAIAAGDPAVRDRAFRQVAASLGVEVPEGGFVVVAHRFMTPTAAEEARIRSLVATVSGDGAIEERLEAAAAIGRLGSPHLDRIEALLLDRVRVATDALRADPITKKLDAVAAARAELDDSRRAALELVFDEEQYPFPYQSPPAPPKAFARYQKTQQEIDRRIEETRKIWDSGDSKAVTLTAEFRRKTADLREARDLLAAARLPAPPVPKDVAHVAFLPLDEKKITLRSLFFDEADLAGHLHDLRTTEENLAMPTSASPVEREQLRITNEYRMLMGRRALALDERLLLAARGHCEEMVRFGYFGHQGATPETLSLDLRVRARGYEGQHVGENIARGRSPQGAHDAWLKSSGHHRNILSEKWTRIGTANVGSHYTQNFGADPKRR